jgi:hypothetical protein
MKKLRRRMSGTAAPKTAHARRSSRAEQRTNGCGPRSKGRWQEIANAEPGIGRALRAHCEPSFGPMIQIIAEL